MMLGFAMVAVAGCSSDSAKSTDGAGAQIKMNVALPSGTTITSIHWALSGACVPANAPAQVKSGDWNVTAPTNGQAAADTQGMASGSVGGLIPNAGCTLTLTGTDSYGTTNGQANNCSSTLTVTAKNGAQGTLAKVNIVCQDGSVRTQANGTGHVSQVVTLTSANGQPHECAGISYFTAAPIEVNQGGTIQLSSFQTTSNPASVTWTSEAGNTFDHADQFNPVFTCHNGGHNTITITIQDVATHLMDAQGNNATCAPSTDTIDVMCDTVIPITTGGAPGTGGATATGGAATGGVNATGGTTQITLPSIITAWAPGDASCTPACSASCTSTFPCTTAACLNLVQCIMPAGKFSTAFGSCYDYSGSDTATLCYCGTADSTGCTSTTANTANGACLGLETAAGMAPGIIFTGFTDTGTEAGKANGLVNCLSGNCNCFIHD